MAVVKNRADRDGKRLFAQVAVPPLAAVILFAYPLAATIGAGRAVTPPDRFQFFDAAFRCRIAAVNVDDA